MIIDSKYTKAFVTDKLTDLKYQELVNFAVILRDFKNKVSQEINSNKLFYMNMSKYEFMTYMRHKYPKQLSSYFDAQLYTQVYTAYENRFDAIQKKITFKHHKFIQFHKYKRSTKKNKRGDLKSVEYKEVSTPLAICMTYLARYGNDNILGFIKSVYDKADEKKQKFYDNILRCCDKFGFNRLMKLALSKRERILNRYSNPIEFKSLTFSGKTTYLPAIIDFNKNRRSKIAGFVTLSVPYRKGLDIPVKISTPYHGKLIDYKKKNKIDQYCYTLKFNEQKKQVAVLLCKDGIRELPDSKVNYVGIDVNIKHNLFSLSNGVTYDFDRKLVESYFKVLNQVDKLNELNSEYSPGKRKQFKLNTFQRCIKASNQRLISTVCKDLKSQGYDHIVLENLNNSFRKSYVKNTEFGEKYNRISHILNIGSLKDEFKHIAVKYDIAVSFVQAEYTSQMCEHCGCIDSENRPEQETFCCVNCGHTMNADLHAAINIKNRVQETVFQQALLKSNPDGTFIPKKLNHK